MRYSDERLERIFDRTAGKCHICWGKLAFRNYPIRGARGPWNVEHSIPRAFGGTDHLNNLYAAHLECNELKGTECTRKCRSAHGRSRAPLSVAQREQKKTESAVITGFLIGAAAGAAIGAPGAAIGAVLGAVAGYDEDPDW
jgi:5-methylcytosine-specific restriction endonuclease McrA